MAEHEKRTCCKLTKSAVLSKLLPILTRGHSAHKNRASTTYDFDSKNLTAYGGLLPVASMLEKLQFQQLVDETLTVKRETRAMPQVSIRAELGLALYVGFSRPRHLRFLT